VRAMPGGAVLLARLPARGLEGAQAGVRGDAHGLSSRARELRVWPSDCRSAASDLSTLNLRVRVGVGVGPLAVRSGEVHYSAEASDHVSHKPEAALLAS
jgi:hypothetical protein